MVRTAKDWGWSPTAVIRNAKNPTKPHPMDYVVASATQILDDEKCQKCGVEAWHAYSTDNTIAFEAEDITCQACAHKEQIEEAEGDKKQRGTTKVVRAVPEEGFDELPDRNAFFERMAKEAEIEIQRKNKKQAR
jgi:hypothetical protein